jgi:putative FmdB family regulatory protein
MPLYDFACDACGERFEAIAAPGAAAPCPACAGEGRRLWTPIPPPAKQLGLRGAKAAESNARRTQREHDKRQAFKAERQKKREQG